MTLAPAYNTEQLELAASVRRYVDHHVGDEVARAEISEMPTPWWKGLAEIGVLGLASDAGGALDLAAACEALGRGAVPGPFASTYVASQLLGGMQREAITTGATIVAVGEPPLLPWAPVAAIFIEISGDEAWLADVDGTIEEVATTAGEPWGRVRLVRREALGDPSRALALGDIAVAAYLAGIGTRLLDVAITYACDRRQFGRAIGDFQAVAHPLADVSIGVRAARELVRVAADAFDVDADVAPAGSACAIARLSASRAAMRAAYQAHQVYGAMGFTVEGPVAFLSHRARQVSLHIGGRTRLRDQALAAHGL